MQRKNTAQLYQFPLRRSIRANRRVAHAVAERNAWIEAEIERGINERFALRQREHWENYRRQQAIRTTDDMRKAIDQSVIQAIDWGSKDGYVIVHYRLPPEWEYDPARCRPVKKAG